VVEELEIGEQDDIFEILISLWVKLESIEIPTLFINLISFDEGKDGLMLIFKRIFLNIILVILKYLLKLLKKDNF